MEARLPDGGVGDCLLGFNPALWGPGWSLVVTDTWCGGGEHLSCLLAHQGEKPQVDEVLAPGRRGLEVHHEHVGKQAEKGEVG